VGCTAKSKPALYLYVLIVGYFLSRASKVRLLALSVKLYCHEVLIYFAEFDLFCLEQIIYAQKSGNIFIFPQFNWGLIG